jgi:cytochrome b561
MGNTIRLVRQVQVAMAVSMALYVVAGEMLARTVTRDPADTLFRALSFVSIIIVGATVVVRRTLVLSSEAALKERSDDSLAMARWKTGHLLLYALCEVVGLFGLVLRMDGFTLANVWGFYLGGFLLLLLYSPRVPRAESR